MHHHLIMILLIWNLVSIPLGRAKIYNFYQIVGSMWPLYRSRCYITIYLVFLNLVVPAL